MTKTALWGIVERYGLTLQSARISNSTYYKIFNLKDSRNALVIKADKVLRMNKYTAEEMILAYVIEGMGGR